MLRPNALLMAALLCLSASSRAEKWCFVVAGDGRADSRSHRVEDKDGINVAVTGEIAKAAADEKPKFLLWSGDLVFGYTKTPEEFEKELRTWVDTMKPLYDRHIPVLACRGNHEAGAAGSANVWRRVFSGKLAMPQDGPVGEKDLTFTYRYRNVLAIGLDEYTTGKEVVDQPWLDSVLSKNRSPLVFPMGHEPAFMDGAHKDTLDADPAKRDAFWTSLIKAGARVFFCGHDHLYDHMTVVRDGDAPGPEMHQIVAGTAGAPFYPKGEYTGSNSGWKLARVKNIVNTYGYIVVEVDGNKATVTFKGRTSPGHYEPMDSFSYTATR